MRMTESELGSLAARMPHGWAAVKDAESFWGDLGRQGRRLLQELLEGTMELWRDEWIGVEFHTSAADRRDYRNGYYRRKRWATPLGMLENVRVPRCRKQGLTQEMFERIDHHQDAIGDSVVEMLLAGVSTRRVGELLERIINLPVSAGQVSRLAKRLDAEVQAFHTKRLEDRYRYLLLDAIHLKARGTPPGDLTLNRPHAARGAPGVDLASSRGSRRSAFYETSSVVVGRGGKPPPPPR